MTMYSVAIPEVHYIYVEVEAVSIEAARAAAVDRLAEGGDDLCEAEYSYTLDDVTKWPVEEI